MATTPLAKGKKFDLHFEMQMVSLESIEIISSKEYVDSLEIEGISKEHIEHHIGRHVVKFFYKYQDSAWIVRKCYKEILELKKKLPGSSLLPREPKVFDKTNNAVLKEALLKFYRSLKSMPCAETYDFFEISSYSLVNKGNKMKECRIKKASGGRYKEGACARFCGGLFKRWGPRWFIITPEGIIYLLSAEEEYARETLLFDHNFSVEYGFRKTGRKRGVLIMTSTRKLMVEAYDYFSLIEILKSLQWAAKKSPYTQVNRFKSFAPVRPPTATAQWYINGFQYFSDLCDALNEAKEEVMITDWWLSPELYLKRPVGPTLNQDTRLDRVLAKIANRGVLVNVLVYKEMKMALYNDSEHVEQHLEALSSNIRVIRHPNNLVFLWSHHEKMCVIDQKVGFMGGLDLCYGRMEYMHHPLTDTNVQSPYFPGIDYANNRIVDFKQVRNHELTLVDRQKIPRMPWRDIALKVVGEPVQDLVRHFTAYWNFANIDLATNEPSDLINIEKPKQDNHKIKQVKRNIMNRLQKKKSGMDLAKMWAAGGAKKDYTKFNDEEEEKEIPMEKKHKFDKQAGGNLLKQEVSKDQDLLTHNDNMFLKNSQSNYFIKEGKEAGGGKLGSVLEAAMNKSKEKELDVNPNMKIDENVKQDYLRSSQSKLKQKLDDKFFRENMIKPKIRALKEDEKSGTCRCQLTRSSSNWSTGLDPNAHEMSIQNAYIQCIQSAEHYIYIENQFFMSSTADEKIVKNQIVQTLAYKIIDMHKRKKPFKVVCVIPLCPGFEGDVRTAPVLRIQMFWQYMTITRGENSLYLQLENAGIDPDDYIHFFGLRNHDLLNGVPVQEIIYIHSKMMIVDDRIAIIGSANINDRSMCGNRDSELAMVVEDLKEAPSSMAGKPFKAATFAHTLRVACWANIFGMTEQEVKDPLNLDMYDKILENADYATDFYRTCFGPYPDETVKYFDGIDPLKNKANPSKYHSLKDKVKGFAVHWPHDFLEEEDLYFRPLEKEGIAPDHSFT